MADDVCGARKVDGTPCQYRPADRCPTHNRKPKGDARPAAKDRPQGKKAWGPDERQVVAGMLASGATVSAAAEAAGVPVRTANDWSNQPAFAAMVSQLRGAMITAIGAKLAAGGGQVAEALLVRALDDSNKSVQVRAQDVALRHVLAYQTSDVLARLEALERGLAGEQQADGGEPQ